MHTETIDFTTLRPNVYKGQRSLDQFLPVRRALRLEYSKQRSIADEAFKQKIIRTNSEIIRSFEEFISKSISSHYASRSSPSSSNSNIIHIAKLIFGLQTNDNDLTLKHIESHIKKIYPELHVQRIGPASRSSEMFATICDHKYAAHLLVIIQQVELFEQQLIRRLLGLLHSRSHYGGNSMVLFCTSDKSTRLPLQNMGYLGKTVEIYRTNETVDLSVADSLLIGENDRFKIGGQLIDTIDENVTCFEPSIMNYRYLYQYSMFEHYSRISSIFSAKRDVLSSLLKQEPNLIGNLLKLGSLREKYVTQDLKKSEDIVEGAVDLCDRLISELLRTHRYTCDQLICYFDMIGDESRTGQFASLLDLYEELLKFDDLGQSADFLEKIRGLHKYANDRLIKRIDKANNSRLIKSSGNTVKDQDVLEILNMYRDRLVNNDNCDSIKKELVEDLMKHCQTLRNPTRIELNEALYYVDYQTVSTRCIPCSRNRTYWLDSCCKELSTLNNIINEGPEEMSLRDLFDEFNVVRDKGSNGQNGAKELEATIFVDLINSMEYQGLIKRDDKGRLKKLIWF